MTSRNTVNQRLSRARKQLYIKDLEAKVRNYEAEGIKVTTEIQQAARKVADENRRLRMLFRVRFGVEDRELEDMLREIDGGWNVNANPTAPVPTLRYRIDTANNSETVMSANENRMGMSNPMLMPQTPMTLPPLSSITNEPLSHKRKFDELQVHHPHEGSSSRLPSPSQSVMSVNMLTTPGPTTMEPNHPMTMGHVQSEPVQHVSSSSHQQLPPQQHLPIPVPTHGVRKPLRDAGQMSGNSPNRTSCEEAALIIANMRGTGSQHEILSELGCGKVPQCAIDNMKLFKILDEVG